MLQQLKEIPIWVRGLLIFPLGCLNGWLVLLLFDRFQPLSSLLVTASILAFLLNFPIQFLQRRGLNRSMAIGLVSILSLLILALLSLILVPLIIEELSELVNNLPGLIESGTQQLQALQAWAIAQQFPGNISDLVERVIGQLSRVLQATSSQLLSILLGTISKVINIFILIILTVFMVLGGETAWKGLFSWLPVEWRMPLQNSIRRTFRGYFAAQALLAGILSIAQTLLFVALGVPYAVLYGVSIGIATLIPYASTLVILIVSVLVTLDNVSLGLKVLVGAIAVSFINDNVLSPRIMGQSIGLNPIWLIISLFLGGKAAGILGLVIAVPIASVVKQMGDAMRHTISDDQSERVKAVDPLNAS